MSSRANHSSRLLTRNIYTCMYVSLLVLHSPTQPTNRPDHMDTDAISGRAVLRLRCVAHARLRHSAILELSRGGRDRRGVAADEGIIAII